MFSTCIKPSIYIIMYLNCICINIMFLNYHSRVFSYFERFDPKSAGTDNTYVTIYPLGEDFVTSSEGDIIHSFDPVTLETKGRVS